jgi:hypothetical protein
MANACYDRVWYCTKCGNRISYTIPRRRGKMHEAGHLKKLWCLNCKQEWNAAETEEWTKYSKEDFFFEFNNGNFSAEGERILPYGQFRMKMHNQGKELPS